MNIWPIHTEYLSRWEQLKNTMNKYWPIQTEYLPRWEQLKNTMNEYMANTNWIFIQMRTVKKYHEWIYGQYTLNTYPDESHLENK